MPPLTTFPDGAMRALRPHRQRLTVYTVELGSSSPTYPFSRETFTLRSDAVQFIEDVRRDNPETAAKLRIEERKLEAGSLN